MPKHKKAKPTRKPKVKVDPNQVILGIHLLKYGDGRMQIDVTTEHTCVHAHLDKGLEAFDGVFKDMFKSLPVVGQLMSQAMGKGGPGGPFEPCPGHDGDSPVQVPPGEEIRVDEHGNEIATGKPAKLTPKQRALLKAAARANFEAQAAGARAQAAVARVNLAMNPDQGTPVKAKAKPGRKRKAKGPKAAEAAQPVF